MFLPTLIGVLSSLLILFFLHFCKENHISQQWESNSRTNASSIRREPLDRPPRRPALYNLQEMINRQSAARSTSCRKQKTKVFVSYVPTRPLFFQLTAANDQTIRKTRHRSKVVFFSSCRVSVVVVRCCWRVSY